MQLAQSAQSSRSAVATRGTAVRSASRPYLLPRSAPRSITRTVAFMENKQTPPTMKTISVGQKLPCEHTLYVYNPKDETPTPVRVHDIFKGKKVVLFGLPGAFTAVCSSKHLPEYNAKCDNLKSKGVDKIVCTSINDAYVMKAWAEQLGVDQEKVMITADGDGDFHRAMGLVQRLPGLGERSLRYSMFVDDGTVKILNVDEPGPKSYKVSGPDHMAEDLTKLMAEH